MSRLFRFIARMRCGYSPRVAWILSRTSEQWRMK